MSLHEARSVWKVWKNQKKMVLSAFNVVYSEKVYKQSVCRKCTNMCIAILLWCLLLQLPSGDTFLSLLFLIMKIFLKHFCFSLFIYFYFFFDKIHFSFASIRRHKAHSSNVSTRNGQKQNRTKKYNERSTWIERAGVNERFTFWRHWHRWYNTCQRFH